MRFNKFKTSVVVFGFALAASTAFADPNNSGANNRHTPNFNGSNWVTLNNVSGHCVRTYVDGRQINVWNGSRQGFTATRNNNYMVTVFKGSCGGSGLYNQWFNGNNGTWTVR